MEKKRLILGPSHVMRLIQAVDSDVIPKSTCTDLYGYGGAPVWGDFIKKKSKDFAKYDELIFIVGDFRFGNKTLVDDSVINNQHSISKELITDANDKIMYDKVINELKILASSEFKTKIKFIFWCLTLREYKNKKSGKYTDPMTGKYVHPIWNLSEVESLFPDNIVKVNINNNLDMLSIDSSNHPSFLGYVYLNSLIYGFPNIPKTIDIFPSRRLYTTKIIGDSKLIKSVNLCCKKGILDARYFLEHVNYVDLEKYLINNVGDVVFVSNIHFSNNQSDFLSQVNELYLLKEKYGTRLNILFWEAFAQEVISSRVSSRPIPYASFLPKNILFQHKVISELFGNQNLYPVKKIYIGTVTCRTRN